jgi:peroxiredoxin
MSLKLELSRERDHWLSVLDAPTSATMNRATEALRLSRALDRAVREDDRAPGFRLPDGNGAWVELDTLLQSGPVVLCFFRGNWCPYCNLELRAYQRALKRFRALGAGVVAVSSQTPEHSLATARAHGLEFPVLADAGLAVARAYGLAFDLPAELVALYRRTLNNDLQHWNGAGGWSLPIPATYLFGQDGRVLLAHLDPDYRERLEPEAILQRLGSDRNLAA